MNLRLEVQNFLNFATLDYIMDDYYASNRPNVATSTVNYNNNVITNKNSLNLIVTSNEEIRVPVVRVVKRRNTANKKERRRTQSINSAYSSLREHIPNVPSDTKLSKVRNFFSNCTISSLTSLTDQNTPISDILHQLLNKRPRRRRNSREQWKLQEVKNPINIPLIEVNLTQTLFQWFSGWAGAVVTEDKRRAPCTNEKRNSSEFLRNSIKLTASLSPSPICTCVFWFSRTFLDKTISIFMTFHPFYVFALFSFSCAANEGLISVIWHLMKTLKSVITLKLNNFI